MNLKEALLEHQNSIFTTKAQTAAISKKATGSIQTGLFSHHRVFYYFEDGYFYYREYFGSGWHKRKPNKAGFVKFLNSLALNVKTLTFTDRRAIFL